MTDTGSPSASPIAATYKEASLLIKLDFPAPESPTTKKICYSYEVSIFKAIWLKFINFIYMNYNQNHLYI